MCTVTVVPTCHGCRMVCNRDERRDRPAALVPAVHPTGALQSIFPIDPPGGGTWIGVNAAGLAAALLNLTTGRNGDALRCGRRLSRGLIIPPLLACPSLSEALRAARRVKASRFHPFRLVLVHGRECGIVSCDGRTPSLQVVHIRRPLLFTSSSLGDELVARPRWSLFEQHVLSGTDEPGWVERQWQFHHHHWSDRPEVSVVMTRADARTVSRTIVDVSDAFVTMRYEPLEDSGTVRLVAVGRAA